jgi:hypothetical protein
MENDKLVALAGIAQRFSDVQKESEYITCVWREDIPRALLCIPSPDLERNHLDQ